MPGVGAQKCLELLYETHTPPSLPPSFRKCLQLNPRGSHAQKHSLPSCPPCTQPPPPTPAAVHLLVPSAPVRPSICLHTFGGNLWPNLRSLPNPSWPHSLSSLRNGKEAAQGLWQEG